MKILFLNMVKPNLFFVGAPKTGTTTFYEIFLKFPEFFSPHTLKEPHYFGEDLHKEIEEFLKLKGKKYKKISKNYYLKGFFDKKAKYLVDFSTYYLFSKSAIKEIIDFNEESKIVVGIREPLSFLESYYLQLLRDLEEELSFKEALNMSEKRKKWKKT